MGTVVNAFKSLLDNYQGPHKKVLTRLWDHAEGQGTLEENLMASFDDERVEITAEEFVAFAGQLQGEQLESFYTEVEGNQDFVSGMNKSLADLPVVEPGGGDLDPRGPGLEPEDGPGRIAPGPSVK